MQTVSLLKEEAAGILPVSHVMDFNLGFYLSPTQSLQSEYVHY